MITVFFNKYDDFEQALLCEKILNNTLHTEESWYFIKQTDDISDKHVKIQNVSEYKRVYDVIIKTTIVVDAILNKQFNLYVYCNDMMCKVRLLKTLRDNHILYTIGDNND